MNPIEFQRKWIGVELKERSAAQEHFLDLCRVLDHPTPAELDPHVEFYMFERGAAQISGGEGWADVWYRGHFAWEYKGRRANLKAEALCHRRVWADWWLKHTGEQVPELVDG